MTAGVIRTRLHKATELVRARDVWLYSQSATEPSDPLDEHMENWAPFEAFMASISRLPNFVIDPELARLATDKDQRDSMVDMKKAGVLKLPFPSMVVETTYSNPNPAKHFHSIVVVSCAPMDVPDHQLLVIGVDPIFKAQPYDFMATSMRIYVDEHGEYLVVCPFGLALTFENRDNECWIGMRAWDLFEIYPISESYLNEVCTDKTAHKLAADAFYALCSSVLLLNTQGIKQEVIETERLNRKRTGSNRPPIPRHTYITIGKVYKRAEGNDTEDYIPRQSPRPHWRRGHLKMVRYGAGREKLRQRYIQPKLVAYKPQIGEPEPDRPSYIVHA